MIFNINARRTKDGGVYIQYQRDGKALDAVCLNWAGFVKWIEVELADENNIPECSSSTDKDISEGKR